MKWPGRLRGRFTARQRRVLIVVALVLCSAGVVAAANHLSNATHTSGEIPLTAPSGPTVTVVDAGQKGSSRQVHISNPVDPSKGREPAGVERVVPLAAAGWQLWTILTGAFVLVARFWEER